MLVAQVNNIIVPFLLDEPSRSNFGFTINFVDNANSKHKFGIIDTRRTSSDFIDTLVVTSEPLCRIRRNLHWKNNYSFIITSSIITVKYNDCSPPHLDFWQVDNDCFRGLCIIISFTWTEIHVWTASSANTPMTWHVCLFKTGESWWIHAILHLACTMWTLIQSYTLRWTCEWLVGSEIRTEENWSNSVSASVMEITLQAL